MATTSMSAFLQFDSLVRERSISSPAMRLNLAAKQDYALSAFMSNRPMGQVLRTGKYMVEKVKVSVGGNFGKFVPGSVHTSSRVNTTQTLSWAPAMYRNSIPMTEAELIFSEGSDEATVFKNFRKSLEQDLTVAHWEGLENLLFSRPNSAGMETISSQNNDCYSVLAYITENDSATASELYKPPVSVWTASTIAQLSPVTYDVWRNAKKTYDSAQPSHPTLGLFSAFGRVTSAINFTPPQGAKLGENYTAGTKPGIEKLMIWTNEDGENMYADLCRAGQDQFRGGTNPSDPSYPNINWRGKAIRKSTALRDNLLEESAGSYTGNAYPAGKARFFFINANHLFLAFHAKKVMDVYDKDGASRQPDTTVRFMESYVQLLCNARNRQGIVYPA